MKTQSRISLIFVLLAAFCGSVGGSEPQSLPVELSWGHASPARRDFYVRLSGEDLTLHDVRGVGLEADDQYRDGAWQTHSGGGDVDGVRLTLRFAEYPVKDRRGLHPIWQGLLDQSDADTMRRLRLDPAYRHDPRKLTVFLDRECTRGFSVTVDQLLQNKVFWAPSLDVYLAAGDPTVAWAECQEQLKPWTGRRVLDRVHREPEASYAQYTALWEDMGSPGYRHPSQPAPGHVVCLGWDSAIPKFGIDRGAGVWNDYGNPDRFRLGLDIGELGNDLRQMWKGQRLVDGLPVVQTFIERDGVRYEVEQLAYPLAGPPGERRGDIAMVLLTKITAVNLEAKAKSVALGLTHRREGAGRSPAGPAVSRGPDALLLEDRSGGDTFLCVQGAGAATGIVEAEKPAAGDKKGPAAMAAAVRLTLELPAGGSQSLVVKLPSPRTPPQDRQRLMALDYAAARQGTLDFWSGWLARGALFQVPEKVVNDLFRANLWHAMRLPRRHGGGGADVRIDLPYSNFAYDQNGTPWPVNQAVYVDYMLYDLRGYHDLAAEELAVMYRNNQEASGHVGGFANWGVYTPGMLYAVGQHYLLSRDRAALARLLPPTFKALDWCLGEIRRAPAASRGLVRAPANDGTGDGVWAFNQAYFYAGIHTLGLALDEIGHPRARECLDVAAALRGRIQRAFAAAAVQSPLVQLRDHTWTPYVPCEALTPRRLMDIWYPTDVDGGATHLLRLKALPAAGPLADSLLDDHEDNLYLKGLGMANEPVYNQQATAYLLRDDPKAAIRAFYSGMGCAFSHSAMESVEHRWVWGQYFCPPSTDGSWFDLYRHMLIDERDDGSLVLLQATPRAWLEDGKQIVVRQAPTYYGKLSMTVSSQAASSRIRAEIDLPATHSPKVLLVRFRHPEGKPIRTATVNGEPWREFDAAKEWVRIAAPRPGRCVVTANYN